jgi:dienelactone hydrolase
LNVKHETVFADAIERGIPTGDLVTINGQIQAYLAEACAPSKYRDVAVLYIPDIIGIWQNSKLMADAFAARGFTCLVLDIFNGDPVPLNPRESFDFKEWFANGSSGDNPHTEEVIDPIVEAGIKYLRKMGYSRVGAVGYCLGAKVCYFMFTFCIPTTKYHPSFFF